MKDWIQPYISDIVQALIGILTIIVLSLLSMIKRKLSDWLDSKTTIQQRDLLTTIGHEAFVYAETQFRNKGGDQKLNAALDYADRELNNLGAKDVTRDSIVAAIHKAWIEHQMLVNPDKLTDKGTSSELSPL